MPNRIDNTKCCCGVTAGSRKQRHNIQPRKCCKREYRCIQKGLGVLDKRFIKLVELQVGNSNVTDRPEFPIFLRFESDGHRLLTLECFWVSATRFAIYGLELKSFSGNGEYITLLKLKEHNAGEVKIEYCRKGRFDDATVALEYVRKRLQIEMNNYQCLNPIYSLTKLLDDAQACGLKRKEPPSGSKVA